MPEILHALFLFFHFLGLSGLIGGLLAQLKSPTRTITPLIFHGSLTQLFTGLGLVAVMEPEVNHSKISVKLLILLIITALVIKYRKHNLPQPTFVTLILLAIANVAIAVFWETEE